MILSPEQMVRLTGRRRKSLQIDWLRKNHVPHYVNAEGHPVVLDSLLPIRHLTDFQLGEVR